MSLPSSAPGMISLNESDTAFLSILPISIDICYEVTGEVLNMPDGLVGAICGTIKIESLGPIVTPSILANMPAGSWSDTRSFTSYVY